jgi:DNA-binding winged helix-turn-helix (wHTH) protein
MPDAILLENRKIGEEAEVDNGLADLAAGELRRRGVPIGLQEEPFQILALLLERPGEIVTREELQSRLSPDGTFVDFDKGLNTAMKKLRQALSDSADAPVFIETISRRGYRFIAPAYSEEQFTTSLGTPNWAKDELPAIRSGIASANGNDPGNKGNAGTPVRMVRPAFLSIALVLAILGVAAGGVWFWLSRKASLSLENMRVTPVTRNGKVRQMAISPDGKFVVFALRDGVRQGLWVHDINTNSEIQLLAFDTVNFPGIAMRLERPGHRT